MNILILGSEGFIGHHCVKHFAGKGCRVYGADLFEQPSQEYTYSRVTRLSPDFGELLSAQSFDAIINAAGSGNVPYSMSHPVSDFESNVLDTIRMLDAVRKSQPGTLYIHISSAAVYGNPSSLPVSERHNPQPLSAYGWHKLMSEQVCSEYTQLYGVRTAIVRPFSVYGPGLKKQLFWDLYQKAIHANGHIEIYGTGKESRDYIHVRDVVNAIDCILSKGLMQGEIYNLASGVETTIAEAVSIYFRALNVQTPYHFNGTVRPGDPLNWRADTGRIEQLGFAAEYNLEAGLHEVARWINILHQ